MATRWGFGSWDILPGDHHILFNAGNEALWAHLRCPSIMSWCCQNIRELIAVSLCTKGWGSKFHYGLLVNILAHFAGRQKIVEAVPRSFGPPSV